MISISAGGSRVNLAELHVQRHAPVGVVSRLCEGETSRQSVSRVFPLWN